MVQLEDKSTSDCFYQSEQDSAINNSKTLKVKYDRDMDKDKTFQKQRETEEGKRCHENQKLQINQGIGT